jgi:hypothetical protein
VTSPADFLLKIFLQIKEYEKVLLYNQSLLWSDEWKGAIADA